MRHHVDCCSFQHVLAYRTPLEDRCKVQRAKPNASELHPQLDIRCPRNNGPSRFVSRGSILTRRHDRMKGA